MNLLFISISVLILLIVIIVAAKPIIAGIKAKSDLIKEKEEEKEKKHDIIVVPKNTWHHIKCTKGPGVRYAITQPDVEHVYEE